LTAKPPQESNVLEPKKEQIGRKNKEAPATPLPDWLPPAVWEEWREHRGKKLTPLARKKQLAKLGELRAQGNDPVAVVNQSIERGWSGFFAVHTQFAVGGKTLADRRAEVNAAIWGVRNEPEPTDITGESERVA
jgi:hypothetical protein